MSGARECHIVVKCSVLVKMGEKGDEERMDVV